MQDRRITGKKIAVIVFCLLLLGLLVINQIVISRIMREKAAPENLSKPKESGFIVAEKTRSQDPQEITEKIWLDPNHQFSEKVFYSGKDEIARLKSSGEEVLEIEGKIPDGRVAFTNITTGTSGEEFYLDNKRSGDYREFYPNGQLKRKAQYSFGRLLDDEDFFNDGTTKMKRDFRDRLVMSDNAEAGEGKMYFRDGKLMYEWSITNTNRGGYARSYNIAGELTQEKIYNEKGELIEVRDYRKKDEP
ncbi:MAG: hypothetical protein HQL27_02135 [Candidatus Omnitrophica bacterium]|nr:hypothetical protein [Candidatus Omnitrophota bacterium]